MAVGEDKLTEMVLRSVHKFLSDELLPGDYSGVFLVDEDFDHDELGDGSGPRSTPYVGIVWLSDELRPFAIGNKESQRNIMFDVWVVCESFLKMLRRPQQVQQLLWNSKAFGVEGAIELFDFDTGSPVTTGEFFEIQTGQIIPLLDQAGLEINVKRKRRNLEHTSVVGVRVEREKIKEAELLT